MSIYDPKLPISFHCPNCKKSHKLRASEAEKQTPADLLPSVLSFKCPGCQVMLKVKVEQGHWLKDMSGQKSVYVINQSELA